jgi:nucleotide-binding universal stress UspA family protein
MRRRGDLRSDHQIRVNPGDVMDTIVVGFDGSQASFVALEWAAQRASVGQCRLSLVRFDAGDPLAGENEAFAFDDAERRVKDVAPDVEITSRTLRGRLPGALLREAEAERAHMLVIGAHHRRPIRSTLSGWRPLRTAAQSSGPVVVVPDDWTDIDGPILVGVDDDTSSDSAMQFAAAEAERLGLELVLLHAWQMPVPRMDGSVAVIAAPSAVKTDHRRVLEAAKEAVAARHPSLAIRTDLVQDNPAAALLTGAGRSSLLVLGSHHRGILAGAVLGSVGQDVLPLAQIPVCVVPTAETAR